MGGRAPGAPPPRSANGFVEIIGGTLFLLRALHFAHAEVLLHTFGQPITLAISRRKIFLYKLHRTKCEIKNFIVENRKHNFILICRNIFKPPKGKYLGQECIPVGCAPSATVVVCWGVGGLVPGGACSGGCLLPGGCLLRGVGIPACTEADPPWTDRQV